MDEGAIKVVAFILLMFIVCGFGFTFFLEPHWWR